MFVSSTFIGTIVEFNQWCYSILCSFMHLSYSRNYTHLSTLVCKPTKCNLLLIIVQIILNSLNYSCYQIEYFWHLSSIWGIYVLIVQLVRTLSCRPRDVWCKSKRRTPYILCVCNIMHYGWMISNCFSRFKSCHTHLKHTTNNHTF